MRTTENQTLAPWDEGFEPPEKELWSNEKLQQALNAVNAGNSKAKAELGKAIYDGDVEDSEEAAVLWLREAAIAGELSACVALGRCYENGFGVFPSTANAFYWYQLAADKGDSSGMSALSLLCFVVGNWSEDKSDKETLHWEAAYWGHICAVTTSNDSIIFGPLSTSMRCGYPTWESLMKSPLNPHTPRKLS